MLVIHYSTLFDLSFCSLFTSESADLYSKIMAELDQTVTRMVFENYSVEKYYDSNIASTGYVVRFGKYKEHQNYDSKKGFPAHTDKSFTSIVQQYHANTLEVQTRDGEWAGFDSTPSSFVYMVGDAFQVCHCFHLTKYLLLILEEKNFKVKEDK